MVVHHVERRLVVNPCLNAIASYTQLEQIRLAKFPRERRLIHHFLIVAEGFDIPAGEVYMPIEASKGELGVYMKSNGGPRPERVHFRGPSFVNLSALPQMAEGEMVADVVAMLRLGPDGPIAPLLGLSRDGGGHASIRALDSHELASIWPTPTSSSAGTS